MKRLFEQFVVPCGEHFGLFRFISQFGLSFLFHYRLNPRLSNWVSDSRLFIGNDAAGHLDKAWLGDVSLVQFWNWALPSNLASEITVTHLKADVASSPLATLLFSGNATFEDQKGFLPELIWIPTTPMPGDNDALHLNGKSWLASGWMCPI